MENDWLVGPVQSVSYGYDSRGSLRSINQPSQVIGTTSGGGTHVHFGELLGRYEDTSHQYFNGRISHSYSSASADGAVSQHDYQYFYDDRGWLTKANNLSDNSMDREYRYDRFGNRRQRISGSDTLDYLYYNDTPGSSRMRKLLGDAYDRQYNVLGQLVSDSTNGVWLMRYDYRGLLDYSKFRASADASASDELFMDYDEAGNRIRKRFHYQYWSECGGGVDPQPLSNSLGSEDLTSGDLSGATISGETDGGGGSTYPCLKWTWTHTYYLYDRGRLVATFDGSDDVLSYFVNGPEGAIAEYRANDNAQLYFNVHDHVGTPRISMYKPTGQLETGSMVKRLHLSPFGEVEEAWGSLESPFKFTGKERDVHGAAFKYDYFGARYYDARHGRFTSLDPARQFASGYLYGGNNPISMVDPNGLWSLNPLDWVKDIFGGTSIDFTDRGFNVSFSKYGQWSWVAPATFALYQGNLLGGGTQAASFYGIPTGIPNLYKGNSVCYSMVSSYATALGNNAVMNIAFGRNALDGWERLSLNFGLQSAISLYEYHKAKAAIERMYGPKDDDPMENDASSNKDTTPLEDFVLEEAKQGAYHPGPQRTGCGRPWILEGGVSGALGIGFGVYFGIDSEGKVWVTGEAIFGIDLTLKAQLKANGMGSASGSIPKENTWYAVPTAHLGVVGVYGTHEFGSNNPSWGWGMSIGLGLTAATKLRYGHVLWRLRENELQPRELGSD